MEKPFFTGPFAPMCELFVRQKRATGFEYNGRERRLRQFDNFCKAYDIHNYEITEELASAYCVRLPNENDNSRRDRVYIMRTFAGFLVAQGYPSYVLEAPKSVAPHTPYIFTKDEMRRLFERADALQATNYTTNAMMLPLLFRILYGCGMRISEALSLLKQDVDVDKGILHINHGKNDRERIVPMSASMLDKCRTFLSEAHSDTPADMPLFYTKSRTAFSRHTIEGKFRNVLWDIGVPYQGKDIGPRLHDLRHTFICHNIQRWAEANIPIHSKLPILSKYVGHATTNATQWYLRMSAEVYPHIREVCERELGCIYTDIPVFFEEGGNE